MEELAKTIGKSDKGSRAKAKFAADRNQFDDGDMMVPLNENGKPLVKISAAASEVIPTGQYANVSIGPVQITMWVDPEKGIDNKELDVIMASANDLAYTIEKDVVAVQRNLVMQSIQDALEG